MGLPILVQAHREIEARLALEPADMGTHGMAFGLAIVAVQVDTLTVGALAQEESFRVQAGHHPEVQVGWPQVLPQEMTDGQWSGRFVAMDSR